MEIKKSSKADLERKRKYFFLAGVLIAGALLYITLEWKYSDTPVLNPEELDAFITLTEELEITEQAYVVPENALPVIQPAATIIEVFDVVDDHASVLPVEIVPWEEMQHEEIVQEAMTLDTTQLKDEEQIYTQVEEMPEFPGGYPAFIRYLAQTIKYPARVVNNKISGRVICSFVINKEGKVTQVEIIQGLEHLTDAEALRVINAMPDWKPGKNRGKPVSVKYIVPITFRL